MKTLRLLGLLALAPVACHTGYSVDPEGLRCDLGDVCPEGFRCQEGLCTRNPDLLVNPCQNITCTTPPGPMCAGTNTMRTYSAEGTCAEGLCTYPSTEVSCAKGCSDGSCIADCTGVSCQLPPAASCLDGNTLRTYASIGTCSAGVCSYAPTDVTCTNGCVQDKCVNQDLCQGVTCNAAPDPTCVGNSLRTFAPNGSCDMGNGMCTYPHSDTPCPGTCAVNKCVPKQWVFNPVAAPLEFEVFGVDQAPGSQGKHVLVVGKGGKVSKYNGTGWTQLNSGTSEDLNAVWFASPSQAFIVGKSSTVLQYDGNQVSRLTIPFLNGSAFNVVGVHGRGSNHVVLATSDGTYLRYDGTNWSNGSLPANNGPYTLRAVFVTSSGEERLGGSCGNNNSSCLAHTGAFGSSWNVRNTNGNGIAAIGPTVGSNSADAILGRVDSTTLIRHNPTTNFATNGSPNLDGRGLVGIAPAAGGVYLLTGGVVATSNGATSRMYRYTNAGLDPNEAIALFRLGGGSAGGGQYIGMNESDGAVVADATANAATVVRVSPTVSEPLSLAEAWTAASVAPNGTRVLMNVHGDLWLTPASGASTVRRLNATGQRLRDVAAGDAFHLLVGDQGRVYRVGNTFQALSTGTTGDFLAACRVSDSEFYLVGEQGRIRSYDGSNLTTHNSSTTVNLTDVHCAGPGDVIACGRDGKVLQLSNGSWAEVTPAFPNNKDLTSCLKAPDGSIYVTGSNAFHRLANGSWSTLNAAAGLTALQYVSANELYAIAEGNKVVRFDGTQWNTQFTSTQPLRAGTSTASGAYFAGDNGTVLEGK